MNFVCLLWTYLLGRGKCWRIRTLMTSLTILACHNQRLVKDQIRWWPCNGALWFACLVWKDFQLKNARLKDQLSWKQLKWGHYKCSLYCTPSCSCHCATSQNVGPTMWSFLLFLMGSQSRDRSSTNYTSNSTSKRPQWSDGPWLIPA